MDYILFGAGTGASLAVIGWILREWGPRLRDGKSDDEVIYSASELIDRMNWARFCASCGMAMVVAGTLILLATAVVTAWNPGDDLAAGILVGMYLFVSVLMLVWAFLYTRQFGTGGIYRPAPVNPVSDTLEAVAVTERESSASPSDTPINGESDEAPITETHTELRPDFAEVAASRGGLGRFASFFNRQRPTDSAVNDDSDQQDAPVDTEDERINHESLDASEVLKDKAITEADQPSEDGQERAENQDSVVAAKTGDEVVELSDMVNVEEIGESADVAPESAATDAMTTEGRAEQAEQEVQQNVGDVTTITTIGDPAPVVTPEDDALAELRRRRLARLSGGNQ